MNKVFQKNYVDGFTLDEAVSEAESLNQIYGVNEPNSIWKPATWLPDPDRGSGYMVIIKTKADNT